MTSPVALCTEAQAVAKLLVLRDGRVTLGEDTFSNFSRSLVGAGAAVALDLVALASRLRREAPASSILAIVQLCELAVLASVEAQAAIEKLDLRSLRDVIGASSSSPPPAAHDQTKSALAIRLAALSPKQTPKD